MALPLVALAAVAAIAPAAGAAADSSTSRLAGPGAARVVNATAELLATRRNPGRPRRLGKPITVRVVDRAGLRVAVSAALQAPPASPASDADLQAVLWQRMGLEAGGEAEPPTPPADVSGTYDVASRAVLIGDWVDLEAGRFGLARDAALALLDRRFGLARWLSAGQPRGRANTDAILARQALAEGDAAAQALELVDRDGALPSPRALTAIAAGIRAELAGGDASAVESSPPLSRARRLFATLDGLTFVATTRRRAPWSAVDRLWQSPPRSTEQILHPDSYQRGDHPDDVGARLPGRLRGGWKIAAADTLGELGARVFLARSGDGYRAERAAAGWGGDRALWLQPGGRKAAKTLGAEGFAAWVTTWDDDSDADDFANEAALVLAALARATPPEARPAAGKFRVTDEDGAVFALERRHRAVVLLFGAPAGTEALLAELAGAAGRGGARRR